MKYVVMYRGAMILRTDDISAARKKCEEIGDNSYIQYGRRAIAEFNAARGVTS